jgi:AcrR family transcriptional regulator
LSDRFNRSLNSAPGGAMAGGDAAGRLDARRRYRVDQRSRRPVPRSAGRDRGVAAETRAALIDGAIAALREVGFAGASARQIAQRADCNQALIFYHFGSVRDLLVAALEDISARRMTAYRGLLDHTGTLTELVDCARSIFEEDLDAGHVTVLVEMINGAQSVPGLGEQVSACLAPWRAVAQVAVRDVLGASPFAAMIPAREVAHGVVAGILGLELLANLDGDRASALALFDRARAMAGLLDLTGGLMQPGGAPNTTRGDS